MLEPWRSEMQRTVSSYDTLRSATKLADYPVPFIRYDPNDPEKGADERRAFEELVPR